MSNGESTYYEQGRSLVNSETAGPGPMAINASIKLKAPQSMEQREHDGITANDPPNHAVLIMTGKKNTGLLHLVHYAAGGEVREKRALNLVALGRQEVIQPTCRKHEIDETPIGLHGDRRQWEPQ